ncbi:hypothetical protein SAMN05421786_103239 [Chryseobacterium ureilyticum]|uniref:Uncharacterized protein n=1 Tax=Chryseobacterium ureilyticum TaxID=373668 RepID=A0A1N7N5S1_9FLAO|nr:MULTISPECIES: hypothetical protein [Chryseobacterium]MDR6921221.1 hypothetical protein [Chryseobacterium sp. 2987]SIS93695.1 hypothetical protein SAMN05421786_103239 [Chryseobacterium ureilyticum]
MANVKIIREVTNGSPGNWRLCFQWCEYIYDNGSTEKGYRFIWRRDDDTLQAARGQARIPSFRDMQELIFLAAQDGWLASIE